jgi:hypothetical protein
MRRVEGLEEEEEEGGTIVMVRMVRVDQEILGADIIVTEKDL